MIKCSLSDFILMVGFRYKKRLPVVLCLIDIPTCFQSQKGQKAENEENCISKEKVQNQERGCGGMPLPDAAMGIRTPVASVRGSHDWPDYTIAAQLLNNVGYIFT